MALGWLRWRAWAGVDAVAAAAVGVAGVALGDIHLRFTWRQEVSEVGADIDQEVADMDEERDGANAGRHVAD